MRSSDSDVPARIAKNCTDATLGYMQAATAAYAMIADQTLSFWTTALTGGSQVRKPTDFSVPRPAHSPLPPAAMAPATLPMFGMGFNPWFPVGQPAFEPVQAWWDLCTFQANPTTWPMAYGMICAGVPRDVAFPVARANAALSEAVGLTERSVNRAFSSHRTAGGHASAPIGPQEAGEALAALMMMPLTAMGSLGHPPGRGKSTKRYN